MRITERDLDILTSVATARVLSVREITWLHFSQWREQTQGTDQVRVRRAYLRVQELTQAGYLRLEPIQHYRIGQLGAAVQVFSVTARGMDALMASGRSDEASMPRRFVRGSALHHAWMIGQAYAALRTELAYRNITMGSWVGDYRLSQSYDRIIVHGETERQPVLPDAVTTFLQQLYFVEVDCNQLSLERWIKRVRTYAAYCTDPAYRARFPEHPQFSLLVIVPHEHRRNRMAQRMVETLPFSEVQRYRFLLEADIHPRAIRRRWTQVGEQIKGALTFVDAPLWVPDTSAVGQ